METSHTDSRPLPDYLGVSKHICPDCAGPLHRTGRRPLDHLLSMLVPVRRYRCHRFSCQWEGNFRAHSDRQTDARDTGLLAQERPQQRAPMSFVVHMVVVALGLVLVVVFSLTESKAERDPSYNGIANSLPTPQ